MIRQANIQDIPQILELLDQVASLHQQIRPDLFKENSKKYSKEELIEILNDEHRPILIYEENHNVLGYAFCLFQQHLHHNILSDIKTLYIDDLCVDEKVRGQHIGKKLYQAVLHLAKEYECYNVTLNVYANNHSAIKFYESCGLSMQKIGLEKIL